MAAAQIGQIGNAEQLEAASKVLTDTRKALYGILASDGEARDTSA